MAALNNPQVTMVESRALKHLFTKIRDENTSSQDFVMYSSRIMRILAEEV
jgi:uracil phosphoribosyltransferase